MKIVWLESVLGAMNVATQIFQVYIVESVTSSIGSNPQCASSPGTHQAILTAAIEKLCPKEIR